MPSGYKFVARQQEEDMRKVLFEKGIKFKLSGNEVYFTKSLVLLVKSILCSKLHCQKGINLSGMPSGYKFMARQQEEEMQKVLYDKMYLSITSIESNPVQNRQLIILISNSKQ
jgi:hypothetical protein